MHHLKMQNLKTIVADMTAIVSVLHMALPRRNINRSPTIGSPELGRTVSAGGGQVCFCFYRRVYWRILLFYEDDDDDYFG